MKTEESSHITHIVEAIIEVKEAVRIQQVKEAVKQPIKEAVRNSRSKKLCQTAEARVAQGDEAVFEEAVNQQVKEAVRNSQIKEAVRKQQVKEAVLDSRGQSCCSRRHCQ